MNVNFVSFLDPYKYSGGGEKITKKILEIGKYRKHSIKRTHQEPIKTDYFERPDLTIFWDIYNCPEMNRPFDSVLLERFRERSDKYIYGTGGYEDLCGLGTLPCEGNTDGDSCNVDVRHPTFGYGGIGRLPIQKCPANSRRSLLKHASLCVFFSEHQKDLMFKLGGYETDYLIMVPPFEGIEKFVNLNRERDIKYLSYGGHLEYKGFFNIKKTFPNESPVFIGGGQPDLLALTGYGRYGGIVPYENMPELLNRVENFVHLPRWPEPYGMTTLQAYLCGCNLITNQYSDVVKGRSKEEIVEEVNKHKNCSVFWDTLESL